MPIMAADRPTPQQKRRDATREELKAALARLIASGHPRRLSVAVLAREAGVGRNAIYANHADIIAELRRAARERVLAQPVVEKAPTITDWRAVAADFRGQNQLLATENARLLKRALDAEQAAARAEKQAAALRAELRKTREPGRVRR
jgi:hypothetical protein